MFVVLDAEGQWMSLTVIWQTVTTYLQLFAAETRFTLCINVLTEYFDTHVCTDIAYVDPYLYPLDVAPTIDCYGRR